LSEPLPSGADGTLVDEQGRVACARCVVARSFRDRSRGLLGRKSLERGEGMLITKTSSIHMFFMAFPIDAVFLDKELRIRRIAADLKPWRIAWKRGSKSVLELPAGSASEAGLVVGSRLSWLNQKR
jgi:uncharacterized membrane protein (UPF0127 family)